MSGKRTSIFAGRKIDMRGMILSPALAREMARAKTVGYLTTAAKKPNRWGIERVDMDGNSCLQSSPCQHDAVYWLISGDRVRAHTSNAAELYAVSRLIGVKFDKKGQAHVGDYESRFESLKEQVAAALDAHFAPKPTASAAKKRSADAEPSPAKKQTTASQPDAAKQTTAADSNTE